jgi:hypothetical protein
VTADANKPPTPGPALVRRRVSRRGFLGGALAATLAATLLPADRPISRPLPYHGKARWIGHW